MAYKSQPNTVSIPYLWLTIFTATFSALVAFSVISYGITRLVVDHELEEFRREMKKIDQIKRQ